MGQPEKEQPRLSASLGGELKQGWDSTERLSHRVESFAILKQRTKTFIDWALHGGVPEILEKPHSKTFKLLQDCGQYLIFRNYLVSRRSRLIGACSCKQHLLCAFCASRRGVKNAMAYKEKVVHLANETPGLDLMFLTFTVKNGADLRERFSHLRVAMQTILRHRSYQLAGKKRVTHKTELAKLSGGVFAYEFKLGSGENLWHPHIHMLAHKAGAENIDAEILKNEWEKITGDSHVINIQYCKNDDPFLEVFAYALKFSEMSNADRWYASQLLKGERLISSFGAFRGVDLSDDVTDDILTTEEPFVDLLFRWNSERCSYGAAAVIAKAVKDSAFDEATAGWPDEMKQAFHDEMVNRPELVPSFNSAFNPS